MQKFQGVFRAVDVVKLVLLNYRKYNEFNGLHEQNRLLRLTVSLCHFSRNQIVLLPHLVGKG